MQVYYGLPDIQNITTICRRVVIVIGGGENAYRLLVETAAAETLYGTLRDPTPHGAGAGLFQCDPIGLIDTVDRTPANIHELVRKEFGVDLKRFSHHSLNTSPLVAAIVARLHYRLRPGAIPSTVRERGEYWKKWYNTAAGKGTVDQYVSKVQQYEKWM